MMRIDWVEGDWRIEDDNGIELGRFNNIQVLVPSMLANSDGDRRGYLLVNGKLSADGDTATIKGK